jgi:N-acetylmuramoyl-L-alanine amidase
MSSSRNNAEIGRGGTRSGVPLPSSSASPLPAGHEALQALLAFSSLHDLIKQRRASGSSSASAEDVWAVEQFVLDEVLSLVAERAFALTGADGVAIALADADAIVCRACAGSVTPDRGVRLSPDSGLSGICLRSRDIVRCDDSEYDPRVDANACRRLGVRSMVAIPLLARDSVIGLIEAFSTEAYGFNDSDVRSLNLLGELILAAIKPEEERRMAEISRRVMGVSQQEPGAWATDPGFASPRHEALSRPLPEPAAVQPALVESLSAEELSIDEKQQLVEFNAAVLPAEAIDLFLNSDRSAGTAEKSTPRLAIAILILLVLAASAGVWWMFGSKPRALNPVNEQQDLQRAEQPATATDTAPPDTVQQKAEDSPLITGIRHWSSPDSSTVVIDLQDQVPYEAHQLPDPERIYLDLHDSALAPELVGKTIEIGDRFLLRVRVAQPLDAVSRIVLETKAPFDYAVSLEPNPYRLVIKVRKAQAAAANHQVVTANRSEAQPGSGKFRIVLDAGHGGWDLGTVGTQGLLEKNLVFDIVNRLGALIENRLGAEVVYTRTGDDYVPLEKRTEIANLAQAGLFVSVHANYSDLPSARGVETYYTNTYSSVRARMTAEEVSAEGMRGVDFTNVDIRAKVQESRKLASSVQRALFGVLAAQNPDIRNRGVKKASYVVLTGTTMPAILTEVSFVSSPRDETALQDSAYRQRIAEALFKGVERYAEDSHRVRVAIASSKANGGR